MAKKKKKVSEDVVLVERSEKEPVKAEKKPTSKPKQVPGKYRKFK